LHNCVDTVFILPQYLVLRTLPYYKLGSVCDRVPL